MKFLDPQMEAEQVSFTYDWELLAAGSGCASGLTSSGFAWQLSWDHGPCAHELEDLIKVLISREGYESVLLIAPALGQYRGP